jgi:galactokinase
MGREDLRTEELRTAFERAFDAPPELVVRSPGRVNLIGEHTDYNDGFTLPVALDLGTDVAVRRRPDGLLGTVARRWTPSHQLLQGALDASVRTMPMSCDITWRARQGSNLRPSA